MFRGLRNTTKTKLLGGALLLAFLSVLAFSLFHMSSGMDMAGNSTGCPFMEHGASLCSMSVVDHIGAWQSAFLAVVPTFSLLMLAVATVVILYSVAPHLLVKPSSRLHLFFQFFIPRVYTFPQRPLQELFSNGILHPKLF